jgi:hypothetical protein
MENCCSLHRLEHLTHVTASPKTLWAPKSTTTMIAEGNKVHPPKEEEEIWPHWSQGVPTRFRRRITRPAFSKDDVYYQEAQHYVSLTLSWNEPCSLSYLRRDKLFLPGTHSKAWSGVYRLFAQDTTIDRSCGKDPTGTLYLGLAGSGRGWSILRNRVSSIVNRDHHAFNHWHVSELVQQRFPLDCLAVRWAFTGKIVDHKGDSVPEAIRAEGFLLNSYNDSYGEYPPWNQRG